MSTRVSLQRIGINRSRPNTPFILRWELFAPDGTVKKFSFSCDDRAVIEAFRRQLAAALENGAAFLPSNGGLPAGLSRPASRGSAPVQSPSARAWQPLSRAAQSSDDHPALFDVAADLHQRWDSRAGNTVRGDVDGLVMTFEAMLRATAPTLDDTQRTGLRKYIREVLTPPHVRARLAEQEAARDAAALARRETICADPATRRRYARTDADRAARRERAAAAALAWRTFYDQHGLRWSELDEATVLRVLARLRCRVDGGHAKHNTVARRVITANATLDWAVRRGLLVANPVRTLERHQRPSTSITIRPVDLRLVVSISTCIAIVDTCRQLGQAGDELAERLVPFFALVAFGMLRPSEARCLLAGDFQGLAAGRWGLVVLHASLAAAGARYTTTGQSDQVNGLKHRDPGTSRSVRIPPFAVQTVLTRLARNQLRGDDPLLAGPDGRLVTPGQIYEVWDRIKALVFAEDPVRRNQLDIYDLRHARFSHLLAAGDLDEGLIASWGGNSVPTMRSTYQGVIAAGTGTGATWLADLESFYDEVVPPELQRRTVTAAALDQHLRRVAALSTAVAVGDSEALHAVLAEAQRVLVPTQRTVAEQRAQKSTPAAGPGR